jgi:hypothetical protein
VREGPQSTHSSQRRLFKQNVAFAPCIACALNQYEFRVRTTYRSSFSDDVSKVKPCGTPGLVSELFRRSDKDFQFWYGDQQCFGQRDMKFVETLASYLPSLIVHYLTGNDPVSNPPGRQR